MKKLFAMILSVLLLCGIVTPAFAAGEEDAPALTAVQILSVPLKNRIVFSGGDPVGPDGVRVKLTYSDGSAVTCKIVKNARGYFAADEAVDPDVYITVIRYGVLTAGLWFADGTVKATYRYLSLPYWMNPFFLF